MPSVDLIRVDSEDDNTSISIGSKVRERLSAIEKNTKPREGVVFADSIVNGARVFNVKWDNGSKDFVHASSIEVNEGSSKRPSTPTRSLFSMLSKPSDSPSPSATDAIISGGQYEEPMIIADEMEGSSDSTEDDPNIKYGYSTMNKVVSRQYNGETLSMEVIEDSDDEGDWTCKADKSPEMMCRGCTPM